MAQYCNIFLKYFFSTENFLILCDPRFSFLKRAYLSPFVPLCIYLAWILLDKCRHFVVDILAVLFNLSYCHFVYSRIVAWLNEKTSLMKWSGITYLCVWLLVQTLKFYNFWKQYHTNLLPFHNMAVKLLLVFVFDDLEISKLKETDLRRVSI